MHGLLKRQLRRHGGALDRPPTSWPAFVDAVGEAYDRADLDRQLVEHSLELASEELLARNESLRAELERQAQVEQALRESELRVKAVLDALPDALFRMSGDGTALDARLEAEGAPAPERFFGRALADILPEEVAAHSLVLIARTLESREPSTIGYEQAGSGGRHYYELRFVPFGADEVLAIRRDVTQQRQLEERVRISDRMASIGTLTAGVAHEINNPLSYVIANLVTLDRHLDDDGGPPPLEELREILADALEGAERVRSIVKGMKSFSRGDDITIGAVDVHRCLDTAAQMAANEVRHRARVFRGYADVPEVRANEGQLSQVLLNLVVNAAQAMPEGRVDQNEIRLTTRAQPGWVVVEVTDTGSGIPPEVLGRIFDPFFTTKAIGSGTGLGLYVCDTIIRALGGRIEVESKVGVGTAFRVFLPCVDETPAASPAPACVTTAGDPARRSGRILIVDDEPAIGRAIERMLPGHVVTVLGSGRAATECFATGAVFDVILCDLMMPEVSGMDVYDSVRTLRPELVSRLVFMSGGAFSERARAFVDSVPDRFLQKPFDSAALHVVVEQLLR